MWIFITYSKGADSSAYAVAVFLLYNTKCELIRSCPVQLQLLFPNKRKAKKIDNNVDMIYFQQVWNFYFYLLDFCSMKKSSPNPSLWITKPPQPPTVHEVQQLYGQLCNWTQSHLLYSLIEVWISLGILKYPGTPADDFSPLIRIIFHQPVERRSPFWCPALRSAVRSPPAWRSPGGFPPLLAADKKQQTLQRLAAWYKTLRWRQTRGSSLTVAPEVRGRSPRYWRSSGSSSTHRPGWMRRSSRPSCSCVGFSQSSSVGARWDSVCEWCEGCCFFAVVDGECF